MGETNPTDATAKGRVWRQGLEQQAANEAVAKLVQRPEDLVSGNLPQQPSAPEGAK